MEELKFQELVLKQLELLTNGQNKMQGDITDMRCDITGMQGDISSIQGEISSMKVDITDLRQGMVRIENDLSVKIKALFDAREAQQEFNERILSSVERLEAKVDVLQLETAYLKRIK